ncbi:MAG TPA: hypothetical protein RMH99_28315 [Sandaracinaceae bacterium LLY-WYZ-13_1]|nr:hypothetical protein [Sandaracinaceae bacterium LLY-WYZ-13_1]
MPEHTYTAPRLESALARVKRELGADAVILSSRRLGLDRGFEVRAVAAEHASGWREPAAPTSAAARPLLTRLLIRNGLDEHLAGLLAAAAPGEPRTLRQASEALAESLRAHVGFERPDLSAARKVLAFVGPTGVGKTTTLAKVAAETALVQRRAVGIVTLDSYRVGATAQIEQLADLIGVPLVAAHDADGFSRALRRLADAEVIFVDTAGRAPRDSAALAALAETLHCTEDEVEVTLCLHAASRPLELEDAAKRHAVLLPRTLTITKVDEALQHDAIVAAHVASGLPLAWFTTGQRVPEDVEVATPERLAAALCGEEVYE